MARGPSPGRRSLGDTSSAGEGAISPLVGARRAGGRRCGRGRGAIGHLAEGPALRSAGAAGAGAHDRRYLRDIAVVGTPCQISAIRKMQCLGVLPAHLIKYTIGLFCIENFSFDDVARERLEKKLDINLEDIVKLNVKDDFIITLTKGVTIHVPLEEIHGVARPACFACKDFSNEYADISVGGLGSPDGYTTTLIRTKAGASVYDGALRNGYIQERTFENLEESRLEKTKMMAKIVSFTRRKRVRAEERLLELAGGKSLGGKA